MRGGVAKRTRSSAGFSLLEIVVVLAILGILIFVLVVSQRETDTYERKHPIDLATLPDKSLVVARVRHDVWDASELPRRYLDYTFDESTLITRREDRETREQITVVYDFSARDKVRRIEYGPNDEQRNEWETHGGPRYHVELMQLGDSYAIRLKGYATSGQLEVDQMIAPRVNNGA